MRKNGNPEDPDSTSCAQNPEIKKLGVLLKRGVAELNKNWKVFKEQQQLQQQQQEEGEDLEQVEQEEQQQQQWWQELKQQQQQHEVNMAQNIY